MPATGCTRCSLTVTGPQVSSPMVSLSAPNTWAGCRRHGQSLHGDCPGWETVTCPRANGQQRADLGSEPKQIPEPKAGLALNAADGGLHQHSTQCPLRVSPSGLQPALDLTAGPLPPAPGQTSISHLSQLHAAPRPSQGLLRQALNQSPKLGGGGGEKPQPARCKPKTERFT